MTSSSTSPRLISTLWKALQESDDLPNRFIQDADERIALNDLLEGSALYGRGEELQGRSVLLATKSQLTTASALIELDGVARRIVLCPPELPLEHLPHVIDTAEVDDIVSDRAMTQFGRRPLCFSPCSHTLSPHGPRTEPSCETEWILLTSGTTGLPKLVVHTLSSLCAAIQPQGNKNGKVVWSTFYDIRRYGGLQILLRAILTGTSLVLSSGEEQTSDFLARAASCGVTHISGTPSHWRRALMSSSAYLLEPSYVRLSGEAVDQAIINRLRTTYERAKIVHAFASTEAGVGFEVHDGNTGFPQEVLSCAAGVEVKVEDQTLRIRSAGTAQRYLGNQHRLQKSDDGFIDTGDIVELRDGRYNFAGCRDGIINVAGLKVYPEEIEAVIARHPEVQMCLVRAKKSSITGAIIVADVVLKASSSGGREIIGVQDDILQLCREVLPSYKVPAAINIVPMLVIAGSGKMARRNA